MKKYIKANSDAISKKMAEIQEASNELVDSILTLIGDLPQILQSIDAYDKENAQYGSTLSEEFPQSLQYIIDDIKSVTHDVANISGYYKF